MKFSTVAMALAATSLLAVPAFADGGTAKTTTPPSATTPMKSSGTMMKSDSAMKKAPENSENKPTATGGQPGGTTTKNLTPIL